MLVFFTVVDFALLCVDLALLFRACSFKLIWFLWPHSPSTLGITPRYSRSHLFSRLCTVSCGVITAIIGFSASYCSVRCGAEFFLCFRVRCNTVRLNVVRCNAGLGQSKPVLAARHHEKQPSSLDLPPWRCSGQELISNLRAIIVCFLSTYLLE